MKIISCDKCKKSFREDEIMATVKFTGMYSNEEPVMDLCEVCHDALVDWIETEAKR